MGLGDVDPRLAQGLAGMPFAPPAPDEGLATSRVPLSPGQGGPSIGLGIPIVQGQAVPLGPVAPAPPLVVPTMPGGPSAVPRLEGQRAAALMPQSASNVDLSGMQAPPRVSLARGRQGPDINVDLSGMREPGAQGASPMQGPEPSAAAPAAVGPTVIPAGYQRSRDPIRDSTYAQINKAIDSEASAIQKEADARSAAAEAEAAGYERLAHEHERRNLDYRAARQQWQARVEHFRARADRLSEEAASMKVDSNRYWKNMDTGSTIAVMIGAFLGGLAQGQNRLGSNPFLDTIDRAVQRDISDQERAIDQANKRGQAARVALSDVRAEMGDDLTARLQLADMSYAQVQQQIRAAMTRHTSPVIQARAEQALAQVEMKRAQLQEQRDRAMYTAAHTVGGGAGGIGGGKDAGEQNVVQLPDGRRVVARRTEDAKKLAEASAAALDVERIAGEIDRLRDDKTNLIPGTEGYANLQRLGGQMLFAVKRGEETGALDKGSVEVVEKTIGDPTGWFSRAGPRAMGYAADVKKRVTNMAKAMATEDVSREVQIDPRTGGLKPTHQYTGTAPQAALMPAGWIPAGGGRR